MSENGWRNPVILLAAGTLYGCVLTWGLGAVTVAIAKNATPSDWLGFAGSALGCLFTLTAVAVAYATLDAQKKQATLPLLSAEFLKNEDEITKYTYILNDITIVESAIELEGTYIDKCLRVLVFYGIEEDAKKSFYDYRDLVNKRYPESPIRIVNAMSYVISQIVSHYKHHGPRDSEFDPEKNRIFIETLNDAIFRVRYIINEACDKLERRNSAITRFLGKNIDVHLGI